MPLILSGNVASALGTGYDVANSCRFYSNTRLSRTTGVTTTNTKFTLSFWIKMCDITNHQMIFETYKADGEYLSCGFNLDNAVQPRFYIQEYTGSYIFRKIFTRLSRDMSAWSHYCIKYDSTEGESTRLRVYVNGTEDTVTTTANLPSSNATSIISVGTQYIGYSENQSGHYLHAYLAEFVLVEGTDYAPTDFAEYSEESPTIWIPKDVSGLTFGTNGFYLDFEDSANLGNDANGGTDFTENNLAATDQSTDTCTNNFATWNPLFRKGTTTPAFAEGNLKSTFDDSGANEFALTTFGVSSGKWYAEVKWTSATGTGATATGILDMAYTGTDDPNNAVTNAFGYFGSGQKNVSGTASSYGNSYTTGDIIGIAIDMDNNKLYFSKNGTFQDSGDPTSGSTGTGAISIVSGVTYGIFTSDYNSQVAELNTGSPAYSISSGNADGNGYGNFEYAVPSGYLAICTKNLGSDGG